MFNISRVWSAFQTNAFLWVPDLEEKSLFPAFGGFFLEKM